MNNQGDSKLQSEVIFLEDSPDALPAVCDLSTVQQLANDMLITAIAAEALPASQLTVLLVSAQRSSELHQQHFNDPSPTDVMSFPDGSDDMLSGRMMLGDLAVCPAIAVEAGARHGNTPAQETALYIVHGMLHLLGYDDVDETDRAEMWQRQGELAQPLGIAVHDLA